MAVNAVENVTSTPTTETPTNTNNTGARIAVSEETLSKMTAKEIVDGYNSQNWAVPEQVLTWAQNEVQTNPQSKTTYGEASKTGATGGENDAITYQATLEEQDMSLKDQCKEFTKLSAEKEVRDLGNVTKMAPYTKEIPTDEVDGNSGESTVSNALKDIRKNTFSDGIKSFKENVRFFKALREGTSDDLGEINESLEEMSAVINGTISDAKDSKQFGIMTTILGLVQLSKTKSWHFFGSRRRAAKKAIEQGNKTIKMADRTDKLAKAIAKDHNITINSVDKNIKVVEESQVEEGNTNNPTETTAQPSSQPTPQTSTETNA